MTRLGIQNASTALDLEHQFHAKVAEKKILQRIEPTIFHAQLRKIAIFMLKMLTEFSVLNVCISTKISTLLILDSSKRTWKLIVDYTL